MKRIVPISSLALAASIAIILMGVPVLAAPPADSPGGSGNTKTVLTLQSRPSAGKPDIILSVRLTDGQKPLGEQLVDFYVAADFFGKWEVNLGSTNTDATGNASISYQPHWQGTHVITARFSGNGQYAPVETQLTLNVADPAPQYAPAPSALSALGNGTLLAAGVAVLAVWATLLHVIFRTVGGIARVRSINNNKGGK